MSNFMGFLGATIGSSIGWWLGNYFGFMSAFFVSMIGTGFGLYWGKKLGRDHFG